MADKKRILAKIDELDTYLEELEEMAPKSFEEYRESRKDRRACERLLQIAIEAVLDISYMLIKDEAGLPADEDSIFEALAKKKIITREFCETLKDMKNFRNILVHRYGTVDDARVFDAIKTRLDDFAAFEKYVMEFLSKVQKAESKHGAATGFLKKRPV